MNDIDHVDILIKLVLEIAFEKVEYLTLKNQFFKGGAKNNTPRYCKG